MISEIKCFGCGEKGKYYPYVPSKIYCFSCYDKIVKERDAIRVENVILREALRAIAELDLKHYVLRYEHAIKWMKNRAKIGLEETK